MKKLILKIISLLAVVFNIQSVNAVELSAKRSEETVVNTNTVAQSFSVIFDIAGLTTLRITPLDAYITNITNVGNDIPISNMSLQIDSNTYPCAQNNPINSNINAGYGAKQQIVTTIIKGSYLPAGQYKTRFEITSTIASTSATSTINFDSIFYVVEKGIFLQQQEIQPSY